MSFHLGGVLREEGLFFKKKQKAFDCSGFGCSG
jgi:hypothetical protein